MTILFDASATETFDITKGHYSIKNEKKDDQNITTIYADTSSRLVRFFKWLSGHDYKIEAIAEVLKNASDIETSSKISQNILHKITRNPPKNQKTLKKVEKEAITCIALGAMEGYIAAIAGLVDIGNPSVNVPPWKVSQENLGIGRWAYSEFKEWATSPNVTPHFPETYQQNSDAKEELVKAFDASRKSALRIEADGSFSLNCDVALKELAKTLLSFHERGIIEIDNIPVIIAIAKKIFDETTQMAERQKGAAVSATQPPPAAVQPLFYEDPYGKTADEWGKREATAWAEVMGRDLGNPVVPNRKKASIVYQASKEADIKDYLEKVRATQRWITEADIPTIESEAQIIKTQMDQMIPPSSFVPVNQPPPVTIEQLIDEFGKWAEDEERITNFKPGQAKHIVANFKEACEDLFPLESLSRILNSSRSAGHITEDNVQSILQKATQLLGKEEAT